MITLTKRLRPTAGGAAAWRRTLANARIVFMLYVAGRVFAELEMMTRVIGLNSSLYRSTLLFRDRTVKPETADLSPLSDDFFRLLKGENTVSEFVTDGGRTYARLLDRFVTLQLELKPFLRVPHFP